MDNAELYREAAARKYGIPPLPHGSVSPCEGGAFVECSVWVTHEDLVEDPNLKPPVFDFSGVYLEPPVFDFSGVNAALDALQQPDGYRDARPWRTEPDEQLAREIRPQEIVDAMKRTTDVTLAFNVDGINYVVPVVVTGVSDVSTFSASQVMMTVATHGEPRRVAK